jgi:glycosyltransferase involved in cell wall biosynthesis
LRLLIVTHAALSAQFGASQIAMNLAQGLRDLGHQVTLWSPQPLQARNGWSALGLMRAKLDAFLDLEPPFDVIDAPASLVTARVRRAPFVLVRSVQPDLHYLVSGLGEGWRLSFRRALGMLNRCAQIAYHGCLVLRGWSRADLILCLGELELQWMRRRFPRWGAKLRSYVVALSETDQRGMRQIREARGASRSTQRVRFLWIGRWVRHKGHVELLEFAKRWLSLRPQDALTIAGCGTAGGSAFPRELIASGQLRVVPTYTREELAELLSTHDAGLFTSKVEGWGLVLNEMLESGMPVFATSAGGVPDLMPYFGNQVKRFPPSARDLDLSFCPPVSFARYREQFTWRAIAGRYLELLQEAQCRVRRSNS